MKTYIKLYGPPYVLALKALEKTAAETHEICVGDRCDRIKKSGEQLGDYDFYFEWNKNPSAEQLRGLIEKLDNTLASVGCTYTLTTK
jgi:hypothetical protein